MPTFIQEGFKKTRSRRSSSKRHKAKRYRARRQTTTSRAMSDAMRFPLAMASVGAGIGAFSATVSAFKK